MSEIQSNEFEQTQESSFGEQAEQTSDQGDFGQEQSADRGYGQEQSGEQSGQQSGQQSGRSSFGDEGGLADDSPAQTPGEFGHDPQTQETAYGQQAEKSGEPGQPGEPGQSGEASFGEASFGEEQQGGYGQEAPEVQAGEQGSAYDQGQESEVPQQAEGQQF